MRYIQDRIHGLEKKLDLRLKGQSVLITGASKGIGLATAHAFAAEGCALHLAARNGDALAAARDALTRQYGVAVDIYPMDLGKSASLAELGERGASLPRPATRSARTEFRRRC